MRIKLETDHRVLNNFDIQLPKLTIITGVNGVGKTQLLKSIKDGSVKVDDEELNLTFDIKYINNLSLSEKELTDEERSQAGFANLEYLKTVFNHYKVSDLMVEDKIISILKKISLASGKEIKLLEDSDIETFLPIESGAYSGSVFYNNFLYLFKRYFEKYQSNEFNKFLSKENGNNDIFFLEQEDFIKLYGEAPWDFANEILTYTDLRYVFKSPIGKKFSEDFILELYNTRTNNFVNFENLSTGEKVIMSVVFAMYNSNSDIQFPKLLLMDEPDASLHPSMIKYFLNVIEEVFVKQKGIEVIITTHSPTTIALSNEKNIYIMNGGDLAIEKVSKDEALKILTEGVPSFSINYENRRQVFVESPYDVSYYESFYGMLEHYLNPEISLHFIAAGEAQRNSSGIAINSCDAVVSVTTTLRGAGNNLIYGIIDWDNKDKKPAEDSIKILGMGQRYSIENYIFDPLLMTCLLLREKIIKNEDIGLGGQEREKNIEDFTEDRLQNLVDYILDRLKNELNETNDELVDCKLINEKVIKLPVWFMQLQGHKLEDLYIKIFPSLHSIKRGKEEELKLTIINKVAYSNIGLISCDIKDLLLSLQE